MSIMTVQPEAKRTAMKLADAQLRQDAVMGDPRAQSELARRKAHAEAEQKRRLAHWTRMFVIKLNHDTAMAMMRAKHEKDMAAAEAARAKTRRLEEQTDLSWFRATVGWQRVSAIYKGTGIPIASAKRLHRIQVEQSQIVLPADAPQVPVWRAHAERLLQTHTITCTWVAEAAGLNAYTFATLKKIEVPPITGAGSYAVFLHEVGHVRHPCNHDRPKQTGPKRSPCVPCELLAWQFAIQEARAAWTKPMHERLAESLSTYEPHATADELAEMRALVSMMGFYRGRMDRVTRSVAAAKRETPKPIWPS